MKMFLNDDIHGSQLVMKQKCFPGMTLKLLVLWMRVALYDIP
jgi:hypothetical protein